MSINKFTKTFTVKVTIEYLITNDERKSKTITDSFIKQEVLDTKPYIISDLIDRMEGTEYDRIKIVNFE